MNHIFKIISTAPDQTKRLGFDLAHKAYQQKLGQQASVFGLQGRLGSGKTTFVQGFARGLGIGERITSPTYVIMKNYQLEDCGQFTNFYHVDCYRLEKAEELLRLGWQNISSQNRNILLIEWPGKIKKLLPEDTVFIRFFHLSPDEPDKRKITIKT